MGEGGVRGSGAGVSACKVMSRQAANNTTHLSIYLLELELGQRPREHG